MGSLCKSITFEDSWFVEAGLLDGNDGFIDHMFLGILRFGNLGEEETFFKTVEEDFDGIRWIPWLIELGLVGEFEMMMLA